MEKDFLESLEALVITGGLRLLTILTFLVFMGWALKHLYKMFAS